MATIYETFWDHVDSSAGPEACWPWTRARVPYGYGSLYVPGHTNQMSTHRVAFILTHGPIPPSAVIRHVCDNPPCCNPAHLLLGTVKDNRHDCINRGRLGDSTPHNPERGTSRYNAKMTDESVIQLRRDRRAGMTYWELARKYGLALSTTQAIACGRAWSHVPFD